MVDVALYLSWHISPNLETVTQANICSQVSGLGLVTNDLQVRESRSLRMPI